MSSVLLLVRLALATGVVLAPGVLVARALGLAGAAPALAWALAALFGALGLTFLVHGSLWLTIALLAAVAVVAARVARRRERLVAVPGWRAVAGVGALLGLALWHVAGSIGGDGLFHLARVRKLEAFGDLHLSTMNEFADGGLHPGYAFPLWQGFLALVAKIAAVDPSDVVLHEATVLTPLALLLAYEMGLALFRATGPAVAVVAAQVTVSCLAPGNGGAYTALGLPATASRQLLVPAALALALAAVATPSRAAYASVAAAGLALAVVHPTYAIFLWLPFAGFVAARWLLARSDLKEGVAALLALALPAGGFLVWLAPIVADTRSYDPGAKELARALRQYAGQLDVSSPTSYHLAPEVLGRGGAVAVAALLCVPLAAFAARRRWAAYVLGGAVAVLAVMLFAPLFTRFSDLVSLSQSRRAAGFLPFAFAFAGGLAVLSARLRVLVLPFALAAGVALQLLWPGDFGYRLQSGGPALATWIALAGGVAGLAYGAWRRGAVESRGSLVGVAACLFVLPVAVSAAWNWSPSDARQPSHLTAGLVAALRDDVPQGDIVYSDPETSYRIAASAPVYIANAPPGHVADTKQNDPYGRRTLFRRFERSGDLAIPRRAGAQWLVVDRKRDPELVPSLQPAFRDGRFTLYRIPSRG